MNYDCVSLEDVVDLYGLGEPGDENPRSWPDDDGYSPSTEREYEEGL